MTESVAISVADNIAVVTIDSPPVNAMDQVLRAGLKQAFVQLAGRQDVKAIVLGCRGRTFVAGADIKEFDTGIAEPGYHEV
ncbi:MAG: enoyl-CoA hydratase-related protein, partial [Beijerinckiaceae bacterium]